MSNPAGTTAPFLVGVLYDFPQADGGALFEDAVRTGIDEVAASGRIDRPLELVPRHAHGLPAGTAFDVEKTFAELVDAGVLVILGPTVSDNGLIVGPLADSAGVPCINYTGGERTRGEFMFHYQVGSLEEEPAVLARYVASQGRASVAVAHDNSPVGRRYAEFFAEACGSLGIDITGTASISPLAEDVSPAVARLRSGAPEGLVYLGMGVAARAVALAVESEKWDVPVVANSALMFGYAAARLAGGVGRMGLRRQRVRRQPNPGRAAPALAAKRGRSHRRGRIRHGSVGGRGRGPCRPPHTPWDQRSPRTRQAASRLERHGRDHHELRPLRPRRAEGALPRVAEVGGRQVRAGRRSVTVAR